MTQLTSVGEVRGDRKGVEKTRLEEGLGWREGGFIFNFVASLQSIISLRAFFIASGMPSIGSAFKLCACIVPALK